MILIVFDIGDINKYTKKIDYFGEGVWDLKTSFKLNVPFTGVDFTQSGVLKKLVLNFTSMIIMIQRRF